MAAIELRTANPADVEDIAAAVALGNASRATLGFLPKGAYHDGARKGVLLLARDHGRIVAYALCALTRRHVRLVHLCVAAERRGEGIARRLVDWISERHAEFPGILVRCRHDYGLGDMWIALGFSQLSEAPGRSKEQRAVVRWWRDHGHPNLFTRPADDVLVRASIDLNILRDLVDPKRRDAADSLALVDDQFTDRLELVRTAALDTEIDDLATGLRGPCIARASALASVSPETGRARLLEQALANAARRQRPNYPQTEQDRMDLRHVAEAIAAGLNVFITRDASLANLLGDIAVKEHGLRILQPADVIVHIDELVRAEAYRPALLAQTRFTRQVLGVGHEQQLTRLVNSENRETARAFLRLLRTMALSGRERSGVYAPSGELVAIYVASVEGVLLAAPVFRVARSAEADTLARQIIFLLRQRAREAGAHVIHIADKYMSREAVLAATTDGFLPHPHHPGYYGFVMNLIADAAAVEHKATVAADEAGVPRPAPLSPRLPAIAAAEIERRWWPVKILDCDLPTYVVPIQETFSRDLLGEPRGLFPRDSGLGLSREHVYFRSVGGPILQAPARILWYKSGFGRHTAAAGVIACSALDDVVTAAPAELHMRFRHLGVWSLDQIERVAHGGTAQALRFSNTEIFPRPIALEELRQLGRVHHEHGVPQAPRKISTDFFASLYRMGTRT